MVFAVAGGGQLDAGGYSIDNALRFNAPETDRLYRTPSSSGNRQVFTWSGWLKLGEKFDTENKIFGVADTSNPLYIQFTDNTASALTVAKWNGSSHVFRLTTTQLFKDASAWYHIVVAFDTTQATSSNRIKIYVNGNQVTDFGTASYPSQNYTTEMNHTEPHYLGLTSSNTGNPFDGYMAEVQLIDGQQLAASDFGEFDEDSGIWKPIEYTGSYGTNGFYFKFQNPNDAGEDSSGNGNNFTGDGGLDGTSIVTDTPTNNFCTLNPNDAVDAAGSDYQLEYQISEGNLRLKGGGAGTGDDAARCTVPIQSGKWYFEAEVTDIAKVAWIGISKADDKIQRGSDLQTDTSSTSVIWDLKNGDVSKNGSTASTGYTTSNGDIVGLAFDLDNGNLYIYKNGTALNSGSAVVTGITSDTLYVPYASCENGSTKGELALNFGNPIITIASGNSDANGYGNFEYAPKSGGYLAICTKNLANEISSTIDNSSNSFGVSTWTSTGADINITDLNFQPDFVIHKCRANVNRHWHWFSSNFFTSGTGTWMQTSNTDTEANLANTGLTSYLSNGFTMEVNTGQGFEVSGNTQVAWSWYINGGSTSSNTNGSITTSVQANQDLGISIISYTGTGSNATIGHGLSKAPEVYFAKSRSSGTYGWGGNFWSYRNTGQIQLNADSSYYENAVYWQNTDPSNTVITMGGQVEANLSGATFIGYCFHSVEGFSKMGVYTGNGNGYGPFITTGFRPAFVMWKRLDSSTDWRILDTARDPYNVAKGRLFPNNTSQENTGQNTVDFFSNGFRIVTTNSGANASGGKYGYMAFAENPFATSTGVAGIAR